MDLPTKVIGAHYKKNSVYGQSKQQIKSPLIGFSEAGPVPLKILKKASLLLKTVLFLLISNLNKGHPMAAENALYVILKEKINQDVLVLPMLPEIALKVRQASDDPKISLAQMGELISRDPALSLGIIKVANSALLGRRVKVETISQAVNRIGLRQIKSIATAMAIQQVFVAKNSIVATYMKKSWQKTIAVASVAITLKRQFYVGWLQNLKKTMALI